MAHGPATTAKRLSTSALLQLQLQPLPKDQLRTLNVELDSIAIVTDIMGDLRPLIHQSPPVDISKPYSPSSLSGKVVLITGGANGLGSHFVRHWASHGANIIIGDIDDAAGEALVASLRVAYARSFFAYHHCDVTDWTSQTAVFDAAVKESPTGGVDIVVPNAGIVIFDQSYAFENPTLVDGKLAKPNTATIDINVTGVIYSTHLALHHLPRNGAGRDRCILLIGSLASLFPLPGQCQYAMSKHAVLGLFRTLRGGGSAAVTQHGVRVNMLAPYYVAQSKMLPGGAEAALLSGGAGAARIEDVIDAATRLVADEEVVGRALMVGPRIKGSPKEGVEVGEDEGDGEGRAVWECYAEDYDQVEMLTYRYVHILNAVAVARGYFAWVTDVFNIWRRK